MVMKQKLYRNTLLLIICVFSLSLQAQKRKIKEATEDFDGYAYVDARKLYTHLADRGFKTKDVLRRLGDSYYFTGEYKEAANWYAKLLKNDKKPSAENAEYYFRYAQSLKSTGKYGLSDREMEKFLTLKKDDYRGELFLKERDYLKEIEEQSGRYEIKNVSFNSGLEDFAPSFYGKQLVFSSNRKESTGDLKHDWNDQPFLDLFLVDNPKSKSPEITRFDKEINTLYHESTSVFNKKKDVVYFTRNNYTKEDKLKTDFEGVTKLKLYRSKKKGDEWSVPEELPFNSDNFSTSHPTLSLDEKTLYFASDRPGTRGSSDLWKIAINDDNSFGQPINLGNIINTEGRETFPFVTEENKLFFASDGHVGLGGLDIFVTDLSYEGAEAYNVGKPINSEVDDFGLILNDETGRGYFSSSRSSGMGNDDIYSCERKEELITKCYQTITGITKDINTEIVLPFSTVELRNVDDEVIATVESDAEGNFSFSEVDCDAFYVIRATKDGYEPAEDTVTTGNRLGAVINTVPYLTPPLKVEDVGSDLTASLRLNPIYFDFDKSFIRRDAALELEKVIAVMSQFPTLKIDVRSHTDSRASDGYNLKLSGRRNVSTKDYIIQIGGINSSRITGKGYGETQLVNRCSNGVECSDEEHQLNRRSEFIIVQR